MALYVRLCLLLYGTCLSSLPLLHECKDQDGCKFPVYSTKSCPSNKTEWDKRSSEMNCNDTNSYMCVPNEKFTELLEFCYKDHRMLIVQDSCLYLNRSHLDVNIYDCRNFEYGCPSYHYLSSEIYTYPSCVHVENGCFVAEPSCKSRPSQKENQINFTTLAISLGVSIPAFCLCMLLFHLIRRKETGSESRVSRLNPREKTGSELHVSLLNHQENKENRKPTLESQSVNGPERDIQPVNVKGHISHLYLSTTGDIWASNDRGKVGFIDPSGNDKRSIETCSTYTGHFALATVDDNDGEHIYWVHNEKMVKKDDKKEPETKTGKWVPISILFSAEEMLFYVGIVKDNDAKITRYNTDWSTKDDIHRYEAEKEESRNLFRYPAYLVKNVNGDLCVSDNNKRVIVVNNNNKFRFKYTGHNQNGFTPYGICTDSRGCILIVDSSSRSIHIINQEGKFQRYIKMSEHFREPRGLCMDKNGNCCVGTYGTILVYSNTSDETPPTTAATTESET